MKAVIIDGRMPHAMRDKLVSFGYAIISLPACRDIAPPVASHPDMLLFFAGKRLICHERYYEVAKSEIDEILSRGYELILSDEKISDKYPEDILFNCFELGGKIYGRTDSISRHIKKYAFEQGIELCNTAQGYAKCSTVCLGNHAAITSDESIKKAVSKSGIDVLKISQGNILLPGYDTGFIGGCSGLDGANIYFSGNIFLHPDGQKIYDFCTNKGFIVNCLDDTPLFDVGTMYFI